MEPSQNMDTSQAYGEMHHDCSVTAIKATNFKEPCYCSVKSDKNLVGVIYCSEVQTSFKNNYIKSEASLKCYQKIMKQKGLVASDRVTENKSKGIMEIWDHIELFGGFMDLESTYKRFCCHQSIVPKKESFLNDILSQSIVSAHCAI